MSELDIYAGNEFTYRDYYLQHHGVKGMKWGVRKTRDGVSNAYQNHKKKRAVKRAESDRIEKLRDFGNNRAPGYDNKMLRRDLVLYGGNGIQEINRNMHEGMSHDEAKSAQFKKAMKQATVALATYAGGKALGATTEYLQTEAGQRTVLAGAAAAGGMFRGAGIDSDKALGYAKLAKKSARGAYKITTAR